MGRERRTTKERHLLGVAVCPNFIEVIENEGGVMGFSGQTVSLCQQTSNALFKR